MILWFEKQRIIFHFDDKTKYHLTFSFRFLSETLKVNDIFDMMGYFKLEQIKMTKKNDLSANLKNHSGIAGNLNRSIAFNYGSG